MSTFSSTPAIEPQAASLLQISSALSHIATTLAVLALDPKATKKLDRRATDAGSDDSGSLITPIQKALRARNLRSQYFDAGLFADPAWDMLLDLFHAEVAQLRMSVSSLANAAAVPSTTAMRWITAMTDAGLFCRRPDPTDARRVFVELSPNASTAMRAYFKELGGPLATSG